MTVARSATAGRARRLRLTAAAVVLVPLLLTAGCSDGERAATTASESRGHAGGGKTTTAPAVSAAKISVTPSDGAESVEPENPVVISAQDGKLENVAVTDEDGEKVDGKMSDDATSWRFEEGLAPGTTYTVTAQAADSAGLTTTTKSTFDTVKARKLVRTAVVPLRGERVGVGQPISVRFSTSIKKAYRAEVERHMKVTSRPAVEGSWNWLDGQRLRYRPMKYWPAGTEVTLRIDLKNLKAGDDGVYGGESRTIKFTIARSMVSVVNIQKHTMSVYRDGALLRKIPVSTGKKGFETRGGVKVVLSKEEHKVMDSTTVGIPKDSPEYYRLDVFWAVRVTYSGEFLHAAPWSRGSQGRANVSHGCVGMSIEAAKWVFGNSIRGDVVEVEGNRSKLMELDNGFGDWNIPWATWKAGSALS